MTKEEIKQAELELKALGKQRQIAQKEDLNQWYRIDPVLGNEWAMFYILLGGREAGKSYSAMDYCLRQWKKNKTPFVWIRLTTISTQKMLANKADKLVEAPLRVKYGLDLSTKGMDVFDHGEKMCRVLALSEMAKEKGVAMYNASYRGMLNIVVDEFQREPGEPVRFDAFYNLVNSLENLCRSRKFNVRIIMICNMLEGANAILADGFNFIPEEFGVYKLVKNKKILMQYINELKACQNANEEQIVNKKYENYDFGKRAVIEYLAPNEGYKLRRSKTIADTLMPTASNFTNKIERDKTLIFKGNLRTPNFIIKFTLDQNDWFTVWNDRVICPYNKEHLDLVVPMRPFINEVYNPQARDAIIGRYDVKGFLYKNIITQAKFEKRLQEVRPTR